MKKTIILNLSRDQFEKNLYCARRTSASDSLTSYPPYFDFDNVTLDDDQLIIEKNLKPFDYSSPYNGITGKINCIVEEKAGKLIIQSKAYPQTVILDIFKYCFGLALGLTCLVILLHDFNLTILGISLLAELALFGIIHLLKLNITNSLFDYHSSLLNYLAKYKHEEDTSFLKSKI